mgnify:CR=1 FL=1
MHSFNKFIVISFYEFIDLNNLEQLKIYFYDFLKKNGFKGTIILAKEGINGTLSCKKEKTILLKQFIKKNLKTVIKFKINQYSKHVFLRLKIKIKNEIIKLGSNNVFPKLESGKYVDPEEWDNLIKNEEVITIDTRNHYESEIGTFKNCLETRTSNFTEFPNWFEKNKKYLKDKKIAMFCTGGIRCEKASSFLIKKGYERIYQLDGGIINYLKITKNKNKEWIGDCFVFDERVAVNENLKKGKYDQCFACRSAITEQDKKSKEYKKGVCCPKCIDLTSSNQKKSFFERNRQIEIAKKKGIKHLGS